MLGPMLRRLALLSFVAIACGCGPKTINDLTRPALIVIVQEPGGFCSSTYAVDAVDAVWLETGCESSSGLIAQGVTIEASDRAELDALMDEVVMLSDDPGCEVPTPSGRRYRFVRTLVSGASEEVRQCDPSVPASALELVRRFEALVGRSTDGGTDAGAPPDAGIDAWI